MIDILCDYIRMVSYGVVILCSLRNIAKRSFTNALFLGDILVSLALLSIGVMSRFFSYGRDDTRTIILTIPVIIWAVIHFYVMIQSNKGKLIWKIKK